VTPPAILATPVFFGDFAFLDPLLGGPPLVVKAHHILGPPIQVGHDETDAREKFVLMPLHLRHHPSGLIPAPGLIHELECDIKPRQRTIVVTAMGES
jgi:hypothetical protein